MTAPEPVQPRGGSRPIALVAGPIGGSRFDVLRSGFRWLCRDGDVCRPGQVIAYCSLWLVPARGFREEASYPGLQVALAVRVGGRLRRCGSDQVNGYLDIIPVYRWSPDEPIAELLVDGDVIPQAEQLRVMFVAGRRYVGAAEVAGMAQGWCDRRRASWGEGEGRRGSVLVSGVCTLSHLMTGAERGFVEMFEETPGPAHLCVIQSDIVEPTSAVLLSQLQRTRDESERLVTDVLGHLGPSGALGDSDRSTARSRVDQSLGMSLIARELVKESPLTARYEILVSGDLVRVPVDAVVVSLHSEYALHYRHRRLGHIVAMHNFRAEQLGISREGMSSEYEPIPRTADDVKRDYVGLVDALRARSSAALVVTNVISGERTNDQASALNAALGEVAQERDISIVDVDALAAGLGIGKHAPDRAHMSAELERRVRGEICSALRSRGIPGF